MLRVLLRANGDPDPLDIMGRTPFSRATHFGRIKAVKILLETARNLCPVDSTGQTPLSDAKAHEMAEILELLENAGKKSLYQERILRRNRL
jgi:ankyrin repeat protein